MLKIQKEDLIPNANGNGHHPQNEGSSEFGESLSKKNGVHKVFLKTFDTVKWMSLNFNLKIIKGGTASNTINSSHPGPDSCG